MEQQVFGAKGTGTPRRPVYEAMRRGFLGRCPQCGNGRLFRAFLKTADQCPACGEQISHHRADDLPAYLVIVIVGHVMVSAFMGVQAMTDWPTWLHMAIWAPLTIALSLVLIGPVKGGVVGLQWALRMHGFGGEDDIVESHLER